MVQFIAGNKGVGKTKKLIDMANSNIKTTDGHIIFIDDDRRHMYDLNYDIRFVETGKHLLSGQREFIGYLLGVLAMDSDIRHIYVDGLTNIVENLDGNSETFSTDISKLAARLQKLSGEHTVDFTVCMNCDPEMLPDEVKKLLV